MQELNEALAAVKPARPALIPEGKTLIGIVLERAPGNVNPYVEGFSDDWERRGVVIARKDGDIIASNLIFGHVVEGEAIINPSYERICRHCGHSVRARRAVFDAKDNAKAHGLTREDLKNVDGDVILGKWGVCPMCHSVAKPDAPVWAKPSVEALRRARSEGREVTRADNIEFAEIDAGYEQILKLLEGRKEPVNPLLIPKSFGVFTGVKASTLSSKWNWVNKGLAAQNMTAEDFNRDRWHKSRGACYDKGRMVFNPGVWVGWVDDDMSTGLFFEPAKGKSIGPRKVVFDAGRVSFEFAR